MSEAPDQPTDLANIGSINVEEEMRRAYIDYSMSVIVGRALPDARDGMKPGNRRILYAMRERGWTHTRPFVKCAKVVGEVIGNFHPHGDQAVYDTLVRMAQDFSLRYMLIHGQGNFGSIDGDPPAAYRYTECKLNNLADEMLTDIDKDTVDMQPNFDETLKEPTVLPARVPNLLVNGSTGIAVGMATNMPPHNLGEIVDAVVYYIDNPDATPRDLMQFVKGPDFPTAGIVRGMTAIQSMYLTGRGHIKMRGRAEIEEDAKGRERIIITEIPYAVNKTTLIEKIADLVTSKRIEGISDLRDESDRHGIRIVVELKRNAVGQVILNNLYKHTQLASTFGAIMLAIDDGKPRLMNLRELIKCFVDHRFEVLTRRTKFELAKAEARAHILEGLKIALDNLDAVVETIRSSPDRPTARDRLMERFGLSELQSNAILDMRLYQLTGLEQDKIEEEYQAIMARIDYLKSLLADDEKLFGVMKDDILDVKESYGDERRTEILPDEGDMNIEDLIADRDFVITITHSGYIKRVPTTVYRQQRRGGKGVIGMDTKEDDFVEHVFSASTHDFIMFFTQQGRCYWKKVYELPEGGRTARGKAMVNLLEISGDDKMTAMIRVREFRDDQFLVMATRKGIIKKTALSAYSRPRAGGIIGINIDEGDRLIGVRLAEVDSEIMLITREGMSIRFREQVVRAMGRVTRGVKGITLKRADDQVVSLEVVEPEGTLLVMCERGHGKRTPFAEYPTKNRGGMGVITMKITERNGKVVAAHTVHDEDSVMLITQEGQMIRMAVNDITTISRNTQGVRLMNLSQEDRLVSATPVAPYEEDEEEEEGEASTHSEASGTPDEDRTGNPEEEAMEKEAPAEESEEG